MKAAAGTLLIAWLATSAVSAQAPSPAPPAPPPGSPGTFRPAADLAQALRAATANAGGMSTAAVANTDQYRVNIVHRTKPAGALAHPGNTELHCIVDGAGTLVTGGTIVRAAGTAAPATIQGGETRRVARGDVVIIPASSPHWYSAVEGTITYLEVRWLAPER